MTGWGWAVLDVSKNGKKVIDYGCIKTEPDNSKKRIRKSDDRIRRLNEITRELMRVHEKHQIDWIVAEAPHGSQSAVAAIMIGATAGLMSTFAMCYSLPIEWYSEGDAKKFLSGKRSVAKTRMIELISSHYGTQWIEKVKYKDEAVADALAVFHVAINQSAALIHAANTDTPKITRTK